MKEILKKKKVQTNRSQISFGALLWKISKFIIATKQTSF